MPRKRLSRSKLSTSRADWCLTIVVINSTYLTCHCDGIYILKLFPYFVMFCLYLYNIWTSTDPRHKSARRSLGLDQTYPKTTTAQLQANTFVQPLPLDPYHPQCRPLIYLLSRLPRLAMTRQASRAGSYFLVLRLRPECFQLFILMHAPEPEPEPHGIYLSMPCMGLSVCVTPWERRGRDRNERSAEEGTHVCFGPWSLVLWSNCMAGGLVKANVKVGTGFSSW